jgi:hypothetical protein
MHGIGVGTDLQFGTCSRIYIAQRERATNDEIGRILHEETDKFKDSKQPLLWHPEITLKKNIRTVPAHPHHNDINWLKDIEQTIINDIADVSKKLTDLPRLLQERGQFTVFGHDADALSHYIHTIQEAVDTNTYIDVRNTVLRYGANSVTLRIPPTLYQKWISAKIASLGHGHTWHEIVSTHLKDNDVQMKFIKDISAEDKGGMHYNVSYLDDEKHPMLQVCIIKYHPRRIKLIFGFEFPGIDSGLCFGTENVEIANYFAQYFDHWYKEVAVPQRNE